MRPANASASGTAPPARGPAAAAARAQDENVERRRRALVDAFAADGALAGAIPGFRQRPAQPVIAARPGQGRRQRNARYLAGALARAPLSHTLYMVP